MSNHYYVYWHVDDNEIVYVGKGQYHRAWCPDNRCEEHREWMIAHLPLLPVEFVATGLSQEEAVKVEREVILDCKPRWNRQYNGKCNSARGERNTKAKLTEDEVLLIKYLLAPLLSQREIAEEFGVSKSTIGKIMSGVNWEWV